MVDYLKNNPKEVIDMFGFEWNEKEERETLIKIGEERDKCQLGIYIVYTFCRGFG